MMETAKTYFDDFDFDNAKIVKHPIIELFQKNKRQFEKLLENKLSSKKEIRDDDSLANSKYWVRR